MVTSFIAYRTSFVWLARNNGLSMPTADKQLSSFWVEFICEQASAEEVQCKHGILDLPTRWYTSTPILWSQALEKVSPEPLVRSFRQQLWDMSRAFYLASVLTQIPHLRSRQWCNISRETERFFCFTHVESPDMLQIRYWNHGHCSEQHCGFPTMCTNPKYTLCVPVSSQGHRLVRSSVLHFATQSYSSPRMWRRGGVSRGNPRDSR